MRRRDEWRDLARKMVSNLLKLYRSLAIRGRSGRRCAVRWASSRRLRPLSCCRAPVRRAPRIPRNRRRHGAKRFWPACRRTPHSGCSGWRRARPRVRPRSIGGYTKGCLAGAAELPADGPNWQVMRPSRNRAWGHPRADRLSRAARRDGAGRRDGRVSWSAISAQPRGGPMLTGHASHQIGLDADLWLTPMPDRRLSAAERDEMPATNVVAANGDDVDPQVLAARAPQAARNRGAQPRGGTHFRQPGDQARAVPRGRRRSGLAAPHPPVVGTQLSFPRAAGLPARRPACQDQPDPPAGDGCGADLAWWFTPEGRHPKPGPPGTAAAGLGPAGRLRRAGRRTLKCPTAPVALVSAAWAPSAAGCGRPRGCARSSSPCRAPPAARPRCRPGRWPRPGARTRRGSIPARRAPRGCGRRA